MAERVSEPEDGRTSSAIEAACDVPESKTSESAGGDAVALPDGDRTEEAVAQTQNTRQSRTVARRRRRRSGPPAWAVTLVSKSRQVRSWVRHNLWQTLRSRRDEILSYAVSLAVLLCLLLILSVWVLPNDSAERIVDSLIAVVQQPAADLQPLKIEPKQIVRPEQIIAGEVDSNLKQLLAEVDAGTDQQDLQSVEQKDPVAELVPTDSQMMQFVKQGELGGRSQAGRQAAVRKYGGNADSERSVSAGLKWLQQLQQKNGSWNFQQVGPAASAGRYRRTEVGATSLALLCYLGAGHTHRKAGPYKETVRAAIEFILSEAEDVQGTADLRGSAEGNSGMYVQALATICLAEAYGLERRDKQLEEMTQQAVSFIERTQDPIGGGWRYRPREAGDTSVVGWQVMALQSVRTGRVRVSSKTLRDVRDFLHSVRGDPQGSTYKYRPEDDAARNSMTAVGLLCRLYLGWKPDLEPMQRGAARLATIGPSRTSLYYNYYATQVLHHLGGEQWRQWNQRMREQLVRTQVKDGPAAGSWAPTDSHGRTGGQIYQTALSILTLEVYYRHLPMYQRLQHNRSSTTD